MLGLDIERSLAGWWTLAAVFFAVVLFVLYSFVGTFVFGLFIYYATRPANNRIYRRVRNRTVAAALSLLLLALPAVLLFAYTIAIALQEVSNLQQVDLGPFAAMVDPYVDISGIVENPANILSDPGNVDTIRSAVVSSFGYLGFLGNGLLHLFVMFALAFYLLRDGSRLSRWMLRFGDDKGVMKTYATTVDRDLKNVFFGNILNAIITGAIGAISFSVLNFFAPEALAIPYPALTGLLAGVASLVPVVGMKLVYVPVVGYLGLQAFLGDAGFSFVLAVFLVSFLVVDTLPDLVLRPYVSGGNLHVGSLMFAYILGPLLFGWYGIFLGPLILVLVVHFSRIVLPELLASSPVKPAAVDPATAPKDPVEAASHTGTTAPQANGGTADRDTETTPDDGTAADGDERSNETEDAFPDERGDDPDGGRASSSSSTDDRSAEGDDRH